MRLSGKIAIVTGAASGFGRGIATRYVAEGARVVVNDIDRAAARRPAAALGEQARFCAADVSKDADVARLVALRSRRSAASTSSSTTRHDASQPADARRDRGGVRPHLRGST
jgi:NAD(P)-dependent dehydrogenase (short-subunit alcohol dehydrogenase family)